MDRQKISWDSANQPYSDAFGDHFYSQADGRAESQHVFLDGNCLPERWTDAGDFTIAELGFGTGLNFLETWYSWRQVRQRGQTLDFVSFEAFPLDARSIVRAISRWPDLVGQLSALLENWDSVAKTPTAWAMDDQTKLTIIVDDALAGLNAWDGNADAWYLDGFSPACNPEMWSAELMKSVFEHTSLGGTFATYTAAGWVRRNLSKSGFEVNKVPGFAKKRHMITGVRR